MPLYEYQCESCSHRFEQIQKYSDPLVEKCPKCGKGPVRKLISSPAIQFKGSGWYITDYAKKPTSDANQSGGAGGSSEKTEKGEKSDKAESSTKSDATTSKSDSSSTTKPE